VQHKRECWPHEALSHVSAPETPTRGVQNRNGNIAWLLPHGVANVKRWSSQLVKKFAIFFSETKVRYSVHNIPPLDPILRQLNPFHILARNSFSLVTSSLSMSVYPKESIQIFQLKMYSFITILVRAKFPAHLFILHLSPLIFSKEYKLCP
jgi:hypothetical protein